MPVPRFQVALCVLACYVAGALAGANTREMQPDQAVKKLHAHLPDSPLVQEIMGKIEWEKEFEIAKEILVRLIQVKSTNRENGVHEDAAVEVVKEYLQRVGLEGEVVAKDEEGVRANLIVRVPKTNAESNLKPILLSAHLDVVPADNVEDWSHDPFSGEVVKDGDDEFIWGRGAIDMKNMAAMSLTTVMMLQKYKVPLDRDVIFAAIADEETGMKFGSRFLVEEHLDKIDAEYAFSEVGGVTYYIKGKKFYMIQIGEKGNCRVDLTIKGVSGHGSMLSSKNPLVLAAKVVDRVASTQFPTHISPGTKGMITSIAPKLPTLKDRVGFGMLAKGGSITHAVLNKMPEKDRKTFYAITHNTHNPTMIAGGNTVNQIPDSAHITFDVRIQPASSKGEAVEELRSVIKEVMEEEQFVLDASNEDWDMPSAEGDPNDPILDLLTDIISKNDDNVNVVATVVPGGTDCKWYMSKGIKCLGYSPTKIPESVPFPSLYHGVDERVPVSGFTWGVRVLFESVISLAASGQAAVNGEAEGVLDPVGNDM